MNTTASLLSRAVVTLLILALSLGSTPAYAMRQERAGAEEIEAELQKSLRVGLEEGKAPSVALGELRRMLLQEYPKDSPVTMQFYGFPGGLQHRVFDSPKSALSEAYKRLTWLPTVARVQVLKERRVDNVVQMTLGSPLLCRTYPGNRSPNYLQKALMYLRRDELDKSFLDDASVVGVSVGAVRRGVDLSVEQIYDLFGIIQEGEVLAKESSFLLDHGVRIMQAIARIVEANDARVDVSRVPAFQPVTVEEVVQRFRGLREAWAQGHEPTIRAYIARALTLSGLSAETMEPRAAVQRANLVQPPRVFYHQGLPVPLLAPGVAAVAFSADPSQGVAELTASGITAGDVILLPDTIAPGTEHQWRVPGIETPILVFRITGIADLTDQDLAALMGVAKNLEGQILRITPQTWSARIVNDQYFSIQY